MRTAKPVEQRFFDKVDKNGPTMPHMTTPCWMWLGNRNPNGYGGFQFQGKFGKAHRYSYQIHYGSIPDGILVCHSCDNPPCVNPEHLFLGTKLDNMIDMYKKGRDHHSKGERNGSHTQPDKRPKGEKNGISKLNKEKVIYIRQQWSNTSRKRGLAKQLAEQLEIDRTLVYMIVNRKLWKHI